MQTLINGTNLRLRREALEMTQHALAQRARIDPSVVSRLERGLQADVHLSVVLALAHALTIPLDTLLADEHQSSRAAYPVLSSELAVVVVELGSLTLLEQQQIAGMLRGYLAVRPVVS